MRNKIINNKILILICGLIAWWSVGFVVINLMFRSFLEPNLIIRVSEIIIGFFVMIVFGNKWLDDFKKVLKNEK